MFASASTLLLSILALSSSSLVAALPNGTPVLQTASANATATPAPALQKFSLVHRESGRCLHPKGGEANPGDNTEVVLYDGCSEPRLQFTYDPATQTFKHVTSGKCLAPLRAEGKKDNPIVLSSACDSEFARFQWVENGGIQHVKTRSCFHLWGAWTNNGAPLNLYEGCGMNRIAFDKIISGIKYRQKDTITDSLSLSQGVDR